MNRIVRTSIGLLVAVLATACSNTDRPQDVASYLQANNLHRGESVDRLLNYRINGWDSIDDTHLVLRANVSDRYLVTLSAPCFGIRSAAAIGFTDTAGNVDRFEEILVSSPGVGQESCDIGTMESLIPN